MANSINRLDLIAAVIEATDFPRAKAAQAVDAVFAEIERALRDGQDVRLPGFGSFAVAVRKASVGRNPRTGEELQLPPSTSVRFKPGKGLKEAVGASEAGQGS